MTDAADLRHKPPCDPADALEVLQRLRKAGHVAYFAGGCVRDTLLKLTPKDWDIATDAPPGRVRENFSSTQAVGAAFGVILVRHKKSVIEVATFRSDGVYEDGRRPSSVRFTTAEEDARRRDFTINGLFFDPVENKVIDYVGGQADLQNRLLRAIGNPADRFQEDHLRLLRAVRFAARFDLQIEPATADAIRVAAPKLKGISPERIGEELRLIFTARTRGRGWKLLWQFKLAEEIFRFLPMGGTADHGMIADHRIPADYGNPADRSELANHPLNHPAIDEARSVFLNLAPDQTIPFGLALAGATLDARLKSPPDAQQIHALLSKPEITKSTRAMRQALKISNEELAEMTGTLAGIEPLLAATTPTIATKKRFLAQPTANLSQILMQSLMKMGIERERIAGLLPELEDLAKHEFAPPPLLTGDDLTAAGFNPGPIFRMILERVYDEQLEGRIVDQSQAMELAREIFSE
jgi:poly(A) polymerase